MAKTLSAVRVSYRTLPCYAVLLPVADRTPSRCPGRAESDSERSDFQQPKHVRSAHPRHRLQSAQRLSTNHRKFGSCVSYNQQTTPESEPKVGQLCYAEATLAVCIVGRPFRIFDDHDRGLESRRYEHDGVFREALTSTDASDGVLVSRISSAHQEGREAADAAIRLGPSLRQVVQGWGRVRGRIGGNRLAIDDDLAIQCQRDGHCIVFAC